MRKDIVGIPHHDLDPKGFERCVGYHIWGQKICANGYCEVSSKENI